MTRFISFPKNFKWGVATSGHQIEGDNIHSDWWEWEQTPGHIQNGERSGRATDHWNRLEEDIDLLKKLNIRQYRFSVEWPRIEPHPGEFNEDAIAHYRKELDLLRKANIEPMITLSHFTLPSWVAKKGGWEWDQVDSVFARFASHVFRALGSGVTDWITLNEPMVTIALGYFDLIDHPFPPGKNDPRAAIQAMQGLLKSHALAYETLHQEARKLHQTVRVGIAHHLRIFDVKGLNPLDHMARYAADSFFNWSFIKALQTGKLRLLLPGKKILPLHWVNKTIPGLKGTQDFIGINYYTRDFVKFGMKAAPSAKHLPNQTDVGWEIYPEGLYRTLKVVSRLFPHQPILMTENGLADKTDRLRTEFIHSHLAAIHKSIQNGARVEGYFHWSLLDNFEWVEGFSPRFGLCEVDYQTFQRRPRPSFEAYSRIAAQNGFSYPFEI